ncbi:MAG: IclR family transcriptional regulator [Acetobacteraceae bacterium]
MAVKPRQSTVQRGSAPARRPPPARAGGEAVQSLARALALLNAAAEAADGATLTDLARQVGLPASTAHRLLTTLEQERYLRFDPLSRLWSVGVQAFVAGSAYARSRGLVALARPHLRRLMEASEETVNLAADEEGVAVYLAQVECRQMMRAFTRPGSRVPLHCSGVGKALLAHASETHLARILHRHGMARLTVKTLTTPAALKQALAEARAQGYAVDDEEHALGLRCIAAPIFDEEGAAIAAVSASGPMVRIPDGRLPVLGRMVLAAAQAISAELGASAPLSARPGARSSR